MLKTKTKAKIKPPSDSKTPTTLRKQGMARIKKGMSPTSQQQEALVRARKKK